MGQHILTVCNQNILHPLLADHIAPARGTQQPYEAATWVDRAPGIAANISSADIVCLQETTSMTSGHVKGPFNVISSAMHARRDKPSVHGVAVLAKTELRVLSAFNWQHQSGEGHSTAAAIVKLPDNGPRVLVASVHLEGYWDGEQDEQELEASKQQGYLELGAILMQVEPHKQHVDAVVIAGDFNEDCLMPGRRFNRHALMQLCGYNYDEHLAATEPTTGRKLDWVYVWSKQPVELEPVYETVPYPQASDHLPVKTQLTFA